MCFVSKNHLERKKALVRITHMWSHQADRSLARRHLAEFTHLEAQLDFIEFSDLLDHLEEIICTVVDTILADKEISGFIRALNPSFQKPSRPFLRMRYSDAIDWLNAQDPPILNEHDKLHVFGDDIAEAAERKIPTLSTDHYFSRTFRQT